MGYIREPFIIYSHGASYIYPNVDDEDYRETKTVERYDYVAANGQTVTHYVGPRDFIEVTFRWQSDALVLQWFSWWDAVKDGSVFVYSTIDAIPICGTPVCGDGSICGYTGYEATVDTIVKADMTEFTPVREDVEGYWSVTIRMREVV